jgi:hypothetical protein
MRISPLVKEIEFDVKKMSEEQCTVFEKQDWSDREMH